MSFAKEVASIIREKRNRKERLAMIFFASVAFAWALIFLLSTTINVATVGLSNADIKSAFFKLAGVILSMFLSLCASFYGDIKTSLRKINEKLDNVKIKSECEHDMDRMEARFYRKG